jgi:2-phospho-L-lactate guanylyltransferase
MGWTAVIPLKAAAERKSRLASAYDSETRLEISEGLFRHVAACIAATGRFKELVRLSPLPPAEDMPVAWWLQEGPEINAELARVRVAFPDRLLVVNADLPLLEPDDLVALLQAAELSGCAIAPDRHGIGTNAVALGPDADFAFAFGPASLEAHLASAPAGVRLVRRTGLAFDLDTVEDVEALLAQERPLPGGLRELLKSGTSR